MTQRCSATYAQASNMHKEFQMQDGEPLPKEIDALFIGLSG